MLAIVLAFSFVNLTPMVGVAVADDAQPAQAGDVEEMKLVEAGDIVDDADEAEGEAEADADAKADAGAEADADAANDAIEDETPATETEPEADEPEADAVADVTVDATKVTEEPAIAEMVAQSLKARVAEKELTIQEATDGVAKIGDTTYASLQEAVNAAKTNDIIVLQSDTTVTGAGVQINNKAITLDLNGHKVNGEGIRGGYGALNINTGSVVTVIGNGGSVVSNGVVLYVYSGGNLTVKGGTYKGGTAGCLYAENLKHGNNYITVYDGHFSCDEYNGKWFVLNKKDGDKEGCIFVVYGGTFVNCNPAANNNENPVENQMAEDCKVAEENGVFTVVSKFVAQVDDQKFETLQDAVKAATDGQTITVLRDITDSKRVTITKSIDIDLNGHTVTGGDANALFMINNADAVVKVTNGKLISGKPSFATRGVIYVQLGAAEVANVELSGGVRGMGAGPGVAGYRGSLTVGEGTVISGSESGIGIFGGGEGYDSTLVVNKGAQITGELYGVAGNGNNDGTSIIINGGSITATGTYPKAEGLAAGIYHPQQGVLTITGGEISGIVGVQMGGGTANISGGTIRSTDADHFGEPFKPISQGDGMVRDGAALSLVSRTVYGPIAVNVTGGTFIATNANQAVMKYGYQKTADKWEVVTPEPTESNLSITGGFFSSQFDSKYGCCALEANADGLHQAFPNHSFVSDADNSVAATCVATGLEAHACEQCGLAGESTVIPIDPNAHQWGEWTVARPAAPGVAGLEQRVCAHNSTHMQTQPIDALPVVPTNPSTQNPGTTNPSNDNNAGTSNDNNGAAAGAAVNPTTPTTPTGQGGVTPPTAGATDSTIGNNATPLADAAAATTGTDGTDEAAEETIEPNETPLAQADKAMAEEGAFNWWPWIIGAIVLLGLLFFIIILARRKKDDDEEEQRA